MKVAVIGSRNINNVGLINQKLDQIHSLNNIITIVSGGAKGVDSIAEKWAIDNKIPTEIYKPDYNLYNKNPKVAPLERNKTIVNNSDIVIAFWDGKSKGSKFTIDYANKQNKKVEIILCQEEINMT